VDAVIPVEPDAAPVFDADVESKIWSV